MATNAEKLAEAEAAYHQLMLTGSVRTVVDQNGERIEYSVVNPANLIRYIADLRSLIAAEGGFVIVRGPLRMVF